MTSSLLKGRRFYCREWAFSKVLHCLETRATAKTCGTLVMGGPGCGKSSMCAEMVWPTVNTGKQVALSKRILTYYFCQAHDIETLAISNFINCLVDQITKSCLISGYTDLLHEPSVQAALSPSQCENNPDEAFKKGVLLPLMSVTPPKEHVFILVDSIDESYLQSINEQPQGSRTIAELLANHHHMFPSWLLLLCSARKQSKSVTRLFTGFRKISLDDLRKSHVVRDVQQYILCRLDQEEQLRQHLSRETAEMLNQLHIKSNGCFLYLEKVLNGVGESFVLLRDIKEIPGTLNGLYLWLCQRLFAKKQFEKIRPILNVILAARRPLTEMELYSCAYTKDTTLQLDEFQNKLKMLNKVLIEGKDGTKILFHHSFAEWLLDVKHCTQKYLCTAADGHGMLAMSFSMHAASLTPPEIHDFALHLLKSSGGSNGDNVGTETSQLALWLLASGAHVESSLSTGTVPKERAVLQLLRQCGAISSAVAPLVEERQLEASPVGGGDDELDSSGRSGLQTAAHDGRLATVQRLLTHGADLEHCDALSQTALSLASRQGHATVVAALLAAGAMVDHCDTDGWTALRSAAWGGHTAVVSQLLEHKADVDHADADKRTALRAASWGGHDDIVRILLQHGALVNKVDNEGRTALIAAAYMGHHDIVKYLLGCGADVNHEDIDGRTALSVAALCVPASSVVSILLEHSADVDHRDKDGMTPLLVAAYEGHRDVCELLLEADADVDHTDASGRSPLHAAVAMGHTEVVGLLLFWGAAVDMIDADGRTVLGLAAQHGTVAVVRQLLDRGMDEMHRDNTGSTPLHLAAVEGNKQACEALLDCGSRSTEADNEGRLPLHMAAQEGHVAAVQTLLAVGSPLDSRAHDGKTPLRAASLEAHHSVIELLLQHGADLDYTDADGRTTLYVLALDNQAETATVLLNHGASATFSDHEGRTPLHVACWQGHFEMAQCLLQHSASTATAVDNEHRTPLQSASWQGHATLVQLLLDYGADVDHTCAQGATALCIAAQEGHEDVVRVLLQHQANPNHADQFGRTPTRVAIKGGHQALVQLLEEYGTAARRTAAPPQPPTVAPPTSQLLQQATAIANGQLHLLGPTLSATTAKSSSTASSSSPGNSLSFTQQLQQCSQRRHRRSKLLSPVSEPSAAVIVSPPSSPYSTGESPASPGNTIHIISNPGMEPFSETDEPVWQPRPAMTDMPAMAGAGITMGSTALSLKSPDTRKKRNGIVTNPNYCTKVNGYVNKLADNDDEEAFQDGANDNSSGESSKKKATRPNGLPLKKETPL